MGEDAQQLVARDALTRTRELGRWVDDHVVELAAYLQWADPRRRRAGRHGPKVARFGPAVDAGRGNQVGFGWRIETSFTGGGLAMFEFLIGLALGVSIIVAMARSRARLNPAIERLLLGDAGNPATSQLPPEVASDIARESPELLHAIQESPAVAVEDQPAEVKQHEMEQIRQAKDPETAAMIARGLIRNPDVAEVFATIAKWRPNSHYGEDAYRNSFRRHINKHVYRGRMEEKRPLELMILVGQKESRKTVPDFTLGDPDGPKKRRVLVELKANLFSSSDVDRALGQMLRYLFAWKQCGPAVLLIGGYVDHDLASLIRYYIGLWRKQMRLPVTVYFVRGREETRLDSETSMPDEEELEAIG